jgi:hypothetical protein
MRRPYLDGNNFFDSPNDESFCGKAIDNGISFSGTEQYIYPCYVYDRHGKLLRIEYPKLKALKKWTSQY